MPPRRSPSVHHFRKHVPEAERPTGGFVIKRRINTEVGFLGSWAVKDILGDKEEAVYSQPDAGFTIVTSDRADRLAVTFAGTQDQFDRALGDAFRKLPRERPTSIRRVEATVSDENGSDFVVATVLNQSVRPMRRHERHMLYAELGAPWMSNTPDRAGPLRIPLYTTPRSSEAEGTASMLNELIALGDTALVLGDLFVSRSSDQPGAEKATRE